MVNLLLMGLKMESFSLLYKSADFLCLMLKATAM